MNHVSLMKAHLYCGGNQMIIFFQMAKIALNITVI
jgi:hypothetical protein